MNNIEQYDELIEKFLSGSMTSDEETSFKEELKTNPELKEHANVVSSLIMGMKRKNEKEESLIIEDIQKENAFQPVAAYMCGDDSAHGGKSRVLKFLIWPISIAAVCVLMFNVFSSAGDKGDELFKNYYSKYSCETLSRGDEDSLVVAQLSELFNGIKEHEDCLGTVKSLETIYNSLDKEYKYRGYANDIAWYLALAYIKNNQTAEAKKVLKRLILDNPNTDIADKCTKILNELNKE